MGLEGKLVASLLDACLKQLDVEYENAYCRAVMRKNIQRLEVAGKVFENVKQGSVLQMKRWAAEKLVGEGVVDSYEEQLGANYISQLIWKEKRNTGELQDLPGNFYQDLRRRIARLQVNDKERAEELRGRLTDIASLRLSKVLAYASKRLRPGMGSRMLPEEGLLLELLLAIVDRWLSHVCMVGRGGSEGS